LVSVVAAVERDLLELEKRSPGVSKSALAASLFALAAGLDDARSSLAMKAMAQERLAKTLAELRVLVPEKQKESPLDEIRARRDKRVAAAEG
jgi:hypothetical protein